MPVFEGVKRRECGNNHPVTMLYSVTRIFEKVKCNQLLDYLDSNNLLCEEQCGFRRNHSTVLAFAEKYKQLANEYV